MKMWAKGSKDLEETCEELNVDGWYVHQIIPKRIFQGDELISAYILLNKND